MAKQHKFAPGDRVRLREGGSPARFVGDKGDVVVVVGKVAGVRWDSYKYQIPMDYHASQVEDLVLIPVVSMPPDAGYYEAITGG